MLDRGNETPVEPPPRSYSLSITTSGYTLIPRPPKNNARSQRPDKLHVTPLRHDIDASSCEDMQGLSRTASANDLLEALSLSDILSIDSSGSNRRKKRRKAQEKQDLGDMLAPLPEKVPQFVREAIKFLREYGKLQNCQL